MKGQRRSHRSQRIIIKLDDIPDLRKGTYGAYADKIMIVGDDMFVIEEARSIKKRDLDQLIKTIKDLQHGDLRGILEKHGFNLPQSKPRAGILHKQRGRSDLVVGKLRTLYMRELRIGIFVVNCSEDLNDRIEEILADQSSSKGSYLRNGEP